MANNIGAIPFVTGDDGMSVLVVTSQRRGRWVFPKGGIEKGESHQGCCKREAFEEAGIKGKVLTDYPITGSIEKSTADGRIHLEVTYYPLLVTGQADSWPEDAERQRRWVQLDEVALLLEGDDLRHLVSQFEDIKDKVRKDAELTLVKMAS